MATAEDMLFWYAPYEYMTSIWSEARDIGIIGRQNEGFNMIEKDCKQIMQIQRFHSSGMLVFEPLHTQRHTPIWK